MLRVMRLTFDICHGSFYYYYNCYEVDWRNDKMKEMIAGKKEYQRELLQIAVPVTLQCLLQSSFSVVDQIMTGQLGSTSIAGIGLGGKFASIFSAYLRCACAAKVPLYAGIFASVANTVLNYLLIFGKAGFPVMGVKGAAWASVIAQLSGCILTVIFFFILHRKNSWKIPFEIRMDKVHMKQYLVILMPLLLCEFLWSLGENVYASIYGHVGTKAFAAMTLTNPLQALVMGALSGVSQAAGVMIGKRLGADDRGSAYQDSKRLLYTGLACSILLSVLVVAFNKYYVSIFHVEDDVKQMTRYVLTAYALVAPVKVQNMILGGILRSGGKTTFVMIIDMIGTWIFGVPLGLLTAFIFHLPIAAVYFVLSMEECVRVIISLAIFRRKKWMQRL